MRKIVLSLLFLFIISFSFSQVKLDSGLVAYYPFNGNANDSSGNGNNPLFNNATLTSDYLGNPNSAYHFNGSNTYMRIPNSPSLNMQNQMSIALRVKPLGFYTGPCYNNMMLMKGDQDYLPGNYFLRFSDIITGCDTSATTTDEQFYGFGVVATTPIVQLNKWYNIVWTFNGTTAKIYVDCNLINTYDSAFSSFTSIYDLFIGRLNNGQYPYWLNGDLDDIRIYNRALTDQEIAAICPLAGTLALTVTNFATSIVNKQIKLDWSVANEDGILNYTVERSITGHSGFIDIGTIPAKKQSNYSFVDNSATVNQDYYYRLAIRENTNTVSYSSIKAAKLIAGNKFIIVYPNPSKGNIAVKVSGYNGNAIFTLTNSLGQLVFKQSELIINDNPIVLSFKELRGVYWLKMETNNESSVQKIIIY